MSFAVVLSSCIQLRDKGLHTRVRLELSLGLFSCPVYTRNFNSTGTKSSYI
jgi:hypothetical protein